MFEITVQQLCDIRHKIDRNDETYSKRVDYSPDIRAHYVFSLFLNRPYWPSAITLVRKEQGHSHQKETPIESFDDLLYSPHTFVFGDRGREPAEAVFDYMRGEINLYERNRELERRTMSELDRACAPAESDAARELIAEITEGEEINFNAPALNELSRTAIVRFLQKKFAILIRHEEEDGRDREG